MKQKISPTIQIGVLVAAAIAIAAFNLFQTHPLTTQSHASEFDNGNISEAPQISNEDRKPLPIPAPVTLRGHSLHLPILMYHHIGDVPANAEHDNIRKGLTVSVESFTEQVQWLKTHGFHSVTLDDIYQSIQGKKKLPKNPVAFTFDDGYADAIENAVPILKQAGYTGSFGIITHDPGQIQGTNSYATWDEINTAKQAGMEIICHTQDHFDGSNPKFTAGFIFSNLTGCQADLRTHIQNSEPYLIYPYGHYTQRYIEQAKKAGFVMALTVHESSYLNLENSMELPRIRVNPGENLETFQKLLEK